MREELELIFDPLPPDDLALFVEEAVVTYTSCLTRSPSWHPVNFFLRGHRGEWMGGCLGYIWGGWLHIRWLWVHEALRGQGQGRRLLSEAEAMAAERGAIGATLETHNPPALAFYQRGGYAVFGTLENYPPGFTKYFLRKSLDKPLGGTSAP